MKKFLALATLFTVLAAINVQANEYIACESGSGDSSYTVEIFEDGIQFSPYEASFSFDLTDIVNERNTNTFHILNKTATVSVEGEEESSVFNAILILNDKRDALNMTISRDNGPFQSYEMSCSFKKTE